VATSHVKSWPLDRFEQMTYPELRSNCLISMLHCGIYSTVLTIQKEILSKDPRSWDNAARLAHHSALTWVWLQKGQCHHG
jgi:hypothetical protein